MASTKGRLLWAQNHSFGIPFSTALKPSHDPESHRRIKSVSVWDPCSTFVYGGHWSEHFTISYVTIKQEIPLGFNPIYLQSWI